MEQLQGVVFCLGESNQWKESAIKSFCQKPNTNVILAFSSLCFCDEEDCVAVYPMSEKRTGIFGVTIAPSYEMNCIRA